MSSMNDLPTDAPERRKLVTVTRAPNSFLQYPAYGEVYIHEFDIHGKPISYGFRQYRVDGDFTAMVQLGYAHQVTLVDGFVPGASIASKPKWLS